MAISFPKMFNILQQSFKVDIVVRKKYVWFATLGTLTIDNVTLIKDNGLKDMWSRPGAIYDLYYLFIMLFKYLRGIIKY